MNPGIMLLVAGTLVAYALASERLATGFLTAPMVFAALGLGLGAAGVFEGGLHMGAPALTFLAEVTLTLVLFTDASRIHFPTLSHAYSIPLRLLGIGLPLCIAFGAVVAWLLFPSAGIVAAILLSAMVAATDAALGLPVVENAQVPVRIRQAINVESGLNDGLALPLILMLAAILDAQGDGSAQGAGYWLGFAGQQLVLGSVAGAAIAFVGGKLLAWASVHDWMSDTFTKIGGVGTALLCYAGAEYFGGNGFVAAFAGGLTIGNTSRTACGCLLVFAEVEGLLLSILMFMFFGILMVWPEASAWTWQHFAYAALSLFLVRPLAVSLSLIGTKLHLGTHAFIGWFGPRGLASILYLLLLIEHSEGDANPVAPAVVLIVLASIFLHGMTAAPGVALYGRYILRVNERESMPEHMGAPELPTRAMRMR